MVIIGANGAGKTRIGTWLEVNGPQKSRTLRIPAQRSIRFPKSASPHWYGGCDKRKIGVRPCGILALIVAEPL